MDNWLHNTILLRAAYHNIGRSYIINLLGLKMRAITYLVMGLCLIGCEPVDYKYPDKKYGVRFDSEYFDKLRECESRPLRNRNKFTVFDYGEGVYVFGRPAEWYSKDKFLGDTCYRASIGPNVYRDEDNEKPDFYRISVHVKVSSTDATGGHSLLTLFLREFEIDDLQEDFLYKTVHEVVTYDPVTNRVTFNIGNKEYEYRLPQP